MIPSQRPRLPLPPPLMMAEPGSFAHFTLTQRWPAVVRRIIAENSFPTRIVSDLEILVRDFTEGLIRLIQDDATDTLDWEHYLVPFVGSPWLAVPWFFAEVYFYRRILEATRYFQPGEWRVFDPFWQQKQMSLESAMPDVRAIASQPSEHPSNHFLLPLLYWGLWGNRADLSLHPDATATGIQTNVNASLDHHRILVDDSSWLLERLMQQPPRRIDLVADNAGFELICDLFLIDGLLNQSLTQTVRLHLKNHPTFVSDATIVDVHHTLTTLEADPVCCPLAQRLNHYLSSGQLQLDADAFWTAPLVFWEMPWSVQTELAQADLVILKGDANYRRLLGDRQWPHTTLFSDVAGYFPAPLVALRTLKSEIVVGLQPTQVAAVSQQDSNWLINGHWGVIQSTGYRQAP
ncbi:protein-glutamate O-methyltransferase family protein (plasmid) [Kovacikia minuta CCNUW1]|uniref:damage-control phosphatase ARMT1 family protein n=1 Tax=Kovacikia minuta TaxID=2931930 RepID=UPI001CCDCAE7|nr:damage-control phosphatase ARMT1 family protein [Kovacikia minuta]UBF30483.1 protein-glutamate O-methyltransferase family protein [Kovacikia minuta CCNUW1]